MARGRELIAKGADVIDIGCLPDVDFPHLEETVAALKREGFKVSVDSGDVDELRRGARAGADYLLSLDESSLDAIDGTSCVPILLPRPPATWTRCCAPSTGARRGASRTSPTRCSIRSISASWPRWCATRSCAARARMSRS